MHAAAGDEHTERVGFQRHAVVGVSRRKIIELKRVAAAWQRARAKYIELYWGPQHIAEVLRAPNQIREDRRTTGWISNDLTVHQSEVALRSALDLIRSNWRAAIGRVRRLVLKSTTLAPTERAWVLRVLSGPKLVEACFDRVFPILPEHDLAPDVERRLAYRVHRLLMRYRGAKPKRLGREWFDIDTNLYRTFIRPAEGHFRGPWISLTGTERGKRVCVPLAGRDLRFLEPHTSRPNSRPGLRVEIGERIVFHGAERRVVEVSRHDVEIGVDKGYRTLLTTSAGSVTQTRGFGEQASTLIRRVADEAVDRARMRRRLAAYERSVRNSDAGKAARIRRRNLGSAALRRRGRRDRAVLRDQINHALNDLFATYPGLRRIFCERLDIRGSRLSRVQNRRLGRWSQGFLHRRLAFKARLNGVELMAVNAAYTSQTCPQCWSTSSKNRNGDRFECRECHCTGSSDSVAATNVLSRGSDRAITIFTPRADVKRILDERWRSAQSGCARDSNEAATAREDDARALRCGASREQLNAMVPCALASSPPIRPEVARGPGCE